MKKISYILFYFGMLAACPSAVGQDLLDLLDKEVPDSLQYTQATFKANRILFGHSVETRKKGILEVVLGTKYWNLPNSRQNSFGADKFSGNFALQYAFSDRFTTGLGAATFDGAINGFLKYRLLRQHDERGKSPIGITLMQGSSHLTRSFGPVSLPENFSDRFSFVTQAIFARKFSRNLSMQISPIYIHTNSRQLNEDTNDFFAAGFGARYKLGNHVSIASEYQYVFGREEGLQGFNPFALGVNWEVSDLILQFLLTNTKGFDETTNILYSPTNFNFKPGGLHIGVTATYMLHLRKKKVSNK